MARATLFEEHASVLPHWVAQGVRAATLVSLDAHLDLQFIEPARIARLRACGNAAAVAELACLHPLSPRRGCFGIEDFLYAAGQLGLVRRLVWVAPPHMLQQGMGAALQMLQQMEGVTVEQLASFQRTPGGWLTGHLLGLELVIGDMLQLVGLALEGPVLVDIDADYFVMVPDDRVWAAPVEVVASLKRWLGADIDVTVARSVGTGFLPLRHRFLADQLAALWEGRAEDARHWQALLDAELAPKTAVEALQAEARWRPDCAATAHALALAMRDTELQQRAATLHPRYADDLVRRLGEFSARSKRLDLATLIALRREVAAFEDTPERTAVAWTALGLLHAVFGQLAGALACAAQAQRHADVHPQLALEIAKLQIAAGHSAEADAWLRRAAADDETRVEAWFQLSRSAAATGDWLFAWRWAVRAQSAAPAWPQLLKWLMLLAHERGDGAGGKVAGGELARLQAVMGRYEQNLSGSAR